MNDGDEEYYMLISYLLRNDAPVEHIRALVRLHPMWEPEPEIVETKEVKIPRLREVVYQKPREYIMPEAPVKEYVENGIVIHVCPPRHASGSRL